MKYYIIASRSMTYAQRMIKTLESAGIPAALRRETGGNGCVYSVRVAQDRITEASKLLQKAGFDVSGIREEGR